MFLLCAPSQHFWYIPPPPFSVASTHFLPQPYIPLYSLVCIFPCEFSHAECHLETAPVLPSSQPFHRTCYFFRGLFSSHCGRQFPLPTLFVYLFLLCHSWCAYFFKLPSPHTGYCVPLQGAGGTFDVSWVLGLSFPTDPSLCDVLEERHQKPASLTFHTYCLNPWQICWDIEGILSIIDRKGGCLIEAGG